MFLNYSCACLIIPSTIPDCDTDHSDDGKVPQVEINGKKVFYWFWVSGQTYLGG